MSQPAASEAAFEALAGAAVDDILARQPVFATSLGDHRFDDRLDDYRPAALDDERRVLAARLAELKQYDLAALPVAHRVDAEVLAVRLQERLLDIADDGEHTWNPLVANPGTALYLLMARDFAPLPERLRNAGGRLAQVPEQLDASRSALHEMPRVHVETAIGQFTGTLGVLDDIARELDGVPALRPSVEPSLAAARDALTTHLAWLTAELDTATGNPRRGRERFARKLGLVLDVEMSPEQVLEAALADIASTEEQIARVARSLGGSPREVLDRLGTMTCQPAQVVLLATVAPRPARRR